MAQSPDHSELAFVQARYYGKGRPGSPLWIVAHTMEAGESSTRAENTAGYFANPGDGRVVSSHYCADDDSIVCCVKLSDTAFTTGNIGNGRGINWEFAGFAAQSGAQWGDAFSMAMLRRAAPYWRADAARYKIPIRRLGIAELMAMRPGLTTHNDLRVAFGGTTHTDPGSGFPWTEFMGMINGSTTEESEPDMGAIVYRVESADPEWNSREFVSDRICRRELRRPGNIRTPAKSGLETVILTDAMLDSLPAASNDTWDTYLTSVAGPEHTSGSAGGSTQHTHVTGPAVE